MGSRQLGQRENSAARRMCVQLVQQHLVDTCDGWSEGDVCARKVYNMVAGWQGGSSLAELRVATVEARGAWRGHANDALL